MTKGKNKKITKYTTGESTGNNETSTKERRNLILVHLKRFDRKQKSCGEHEKLRCVLLVLRQTDGEICTGNTNG